MDVGFSDKVLIVNRWKIVELCNILFKIALAERSTKTRLARFKHAALISFLYSTAARPVEATWLKLGDVEFTDEYVVIKITCAKKRKKSDTPRIRIVPIPTWDPIVQPFIFWVKQPLYQTYQDLVFGYSPQTVLNILQQYGLGGYKLRHSRLTELALHGVDEYTLARIAGHKIPMGSLEHYVVLMWEDIAAKVKIATERIIQKAQQEGKYVEFEYNHLIPQ